MPTLVSKVLNFLWVTVWGKINVWQFISLNKHYFILVCSNIILSLLFIYMAEQTTVRTNQYRALKAEIEQHDVHVVSLKKEIAILEKRNQSLIDSFGLSKVEVDSDTLLKEYESWAVEVRELEQEIRDASKRLGERNAKPPSND